MIGRTISRYVLLSGIILAICCMIVLIIRTHRKKKESEAQIQSLQHCCFQSLNSKQVCIDDFDPNQSTVIFYFHPECEHCQYEAKEIGIHASEFTNVNLLMVSPDKSIQRLKDFATEHHLWEVNNFELLLDSNDNFKTFFGTAIIPSVFIYKNSRLIVRYLGETKIEAILNALQPHYDRNHIKKNGS